MSAIGAIPEGPFSGDRPSNADDQSWWKADIALGARLRQRAAMAQIELDADEAMRASLAFWSSLVLIPGLLFVGGLIYAVSPRHIPPPQAWADGTYWNPCCEPIHVRNGVISSDGRSARYVVGEDKFGRMIEVDKGIGVRDHAIVFGSFNVFVHFNNNSIARPATGAAEALHLFGLDDSVDYKFVKKR